MKTNFEESQRVKKSCGSSKVFAVYSAALTAKQIHGDGDNDMSNDITERLDYKIEDRDDDN
jgi:hypothetical protein